MDQNAQPEVGQSQRVGFGELTTTRSAETASAALAEQAKAAVQSRFIIAATNRRDMMQVRSRILADCARPAFAESAIYRKPVGDGVEGPSIRLAEAAARAMGNITCDVAAIYDDADKRIVRVTATDLEANLTFPKDVTIAKTIERSRPQPGRRIVAQRKNSRGSDVFVIEATDEEILDKENAATSKAMRTCLLRLVPGDILEEALEACRATRSGAVRADPKAVLRKMVDAFAAIGVTAANLAEYLGHPIDTSTPDEIEALRGIRNAIRDKEATWSEVLESARGVSSESSGAPASSARKPLSETLAAKAATIEAKAEVRTSTN